LSSAAPVDDIERGIDAVLLHFDSAARLRFQGALKPGALANFVVIDDLQAKK